MIKLIKTEWIKVRSYPVFWVLVGLYSLSLIISLLAVQSFIDDITLNASKNANIPIPKLPVYSFPYIWHNLAFIAGGRYFIKVILGVIVIILITNELSYKTIRQNIISGLSRTDFVTAKILIIILLSLISTLILFFTGLLLGIRHSNSLEISEIFEKINFLGAYFIEVMTFLMFSFLIGFAVKKAGLAIGLLVLYTPMEEFIKYRVPDSIDAFLPVQAMNHIVRIPHTKLMAIFGQRFQKHIAWEDVLICLLYLAIFTLLTYFISKRRDL